MPEQVQSALQSDRRYVPRWEVNNLVLYKQEATDFYKECLSKDISCSGACIATDEELTSDQKLTLEIHLNDDIAFHVTGRAMWSSAAEGKYLTGLVFNNVSPRVQDLILEYAFNLNKKSLNQHWFKGW